MTRIKTIIVDDESRIRRAIERQVLDCGEEWEVIGSFSDGLEAFEAITSNNIEFDLLITDVRMPEMDGLALIKKLNENKTFCSMIVSGYDDFSYLQAAMREGTVDYILKPVDRNQFRIQLGEVKGKIMKKKKEEQKWQDVFERASLLTKTQQIQLLSEVTWSDEIGQPQIDWNVHFPIGAYRLIYLGIDQFLTVTKKMDTNTWEDWNQTIQQIFEKLYDEEINQYFTKNWWWRAGKFNYWILLYCEKESHQHANTLLHDYFNHIKKDIQRLTPITVSAAIGNEFHDLRELLHIKDELVMLIQQRIIQGGNKIFFLSEQTNRNQQTPAGIQSSIYKYVQQIITTMENETDDDTINLLQLFFHELEMADSPAFIEESVHLLSIRIIDRWMDFDGFSDESRLLTEALHITKYAGNFSQLKAGVKGWVLKVKKGIARLKETDSGPIQRAKEWIHQHLGDQITVKKIADIVYMSPTYFSNLFKAQTGETVLDYVTKCRLKKAKELLEMSDLKVSDISKLLGYQDTKYFSKLFKQWQGKSPSQYRSDHTINHVE